MADLRIGSLFSGYGGLDMGVMAALGGSVAWHVEFDEAPSKILAHHWPDVPNYGDVTTVDWSQVEPVDVITGGSPCQDLSHAGKRAGMTEGTRSNLWVAMREAIAQLRPSLVVWENVRGAYSAAADSELESNARLLADTRRRDGEPVLRALGRVLGDLSDLGYDCRWHGLRAADVGAPHGRFRVFVIAHLADAERGGWDGWAPDALRGPLTRAAAPRRGEDARLLPTPVTTDAIGARNSTAWRSPDAKKANIGDTLTDVIWKMTGQVDPKHLLPTPAVNDMGEGKTPEAWDAWAERMKAAHGNGNGHGKSLSIEAQRLLPTPVYTEARKATWQPSQHRLDGGHEVFLTNALYDAAQGQDWGIYADAIARWEALTRTAPPPTQPSKKGTPQLSPAFSEWMMGLPEGHVTDVPGLSRNDMLKALGNGVVPQQAEAALRFLLGVQAVAA